MVARSVSLSALREDKSSFKFLGDVCRMDDVQLSRFLVAEGVSGKQRATRLRAIGHSINELSNIVGSHFASGPDRMGVQCVRF